MQSNKQTTKVGSNSYILLVLFLWMKSFILTIQSKFLQIVPCESFKRYFLFSL